MQIFDISKDRRFDELWKDTLIKISLGNDSLKENYVNLDPRSFACFTILVDQSKILCFSALQISPDRWGPNIARCSSRMWITPERRFTGMMKFSSGPRFLNSYYCLPLQIKKAKELGIKCIFMSRERNPKAFSNWNNLVNNNCKTNFVTLPGRYNVCGQLNPVPISCKQFVSVDMESLDVIDIWNKNMEKFFIKEDLYLDYKVC